MAVIRPQERYIKCGKPMKAVHKDMGKNFYGDTFSHWVHDGECKGKTDEYKKLMEEVGKIDPVIINKLLKTKPSGKN